MSDGHDKFKQFSQPSITVLSGFSGCGKTSTIRDILLRNLVPKIDNAHLYCEYPEENVYGQIQHLIKINNPNATVSTSKENLNSVLKKFDPQKCNLLIIDDQMNNQDFYLSQIAAVESRHKNCVTFLITQNIFADKKNFLHFKRQARYFILFNDGDAATTRFLKQKFTFLNQRDLPASKFYLLDNLTKKLYDDKWQAIM